MKFFFRLIVLALITISITNCKKDEASFENLVGQWRMTDIHNDDGVSTTAGIVSTYSYHGTEYNTITTFTENPNEFSSTGSYTFEITHIILGIPFTDEIEVPAISETGEWSIDGDIITQVLAGVSNSAVILELNGTTMRLREDVDINLNGTHNKATVFTTFERI